MANNVLYDTLSIRRDEAAGKTVFHRTSAMT